MTEDEMAVAIDEYDQILTRQSELLTGVAKGLKGDPPELTLWDHSDLPVLAARHRDLLRRIVKEVLG